jgi:ATP-dependent DNA helicase RecQ
LIIYTEERLPLDSLYFSKEHYKERKLNYSNKIEAIIDYAKRDNKCRSQLLLSYFGETDTKRCGQCDYCQKRNEVGVSQYEFDIILKDIKSVIFEQGAMLTDGLIDRIKHDQSKVMKVLQWLLDNDKMVYDDENKLKWHA